MKNLLFIGLTLFLLFSCDTGNIDVNQQYIGVWKNSASDLTRTLEVKSSGRCFYEEVKVSGNMSTSISYNGFFVLKDSILTIGFKKLTINEEPVLTGSTWYMTMDDIEYTKQ